VHTILSKPLHAAELAGALAAVLASSGKRERAPEKAPDALV